MKLPRNPANLSPEQKRELGQLRNRASQLALKIGELNVDWFDIEKSLIADNDIDSLDAIDESTEDYADAQFDVILELGKIANSGLFGYIARHDIRQLQFGEGTSWPLPLALYESERSKAIEVVADEDYRRPLRVLPPPADLESQTLEKKRTVVIEVVQASKQGALIITKPSSRGYRRTMTIPEIAEELYPNSNKPKKVLHNQAGQIFRNPQIRKELAELRGGYSLHSTYVEVRGSKRKSLAYYAENFPIDSGVTEAPLEDDTIRSEVANKATHEVLVGTLSKFDKSMRSPSIYKRTFVRERLRVSWENWRAVAAAYSSPGELSNDSMSLRTRLMVAYFSDHPGDFKNDELRKLVETIADEVLAEHLENLRASKTK